MAVLNLQPCTIQYLSVTEGYIDEIGDYHEGGSSWSDNIACDAVPSNGEATERTFEDGVTRSYSFTVYLPASSKVFTVGEKVRLCRLGVSYELEVKGFMPYQLQSKLWLG